MNYLLLHLSCLSEGKLYNLFCEKGIIPNMAIIICKLLLFSYKYYKNYHTTIFCVIKINIYIYITESNML